MILWTFFFAGDSEYITRIADLEFLEFPLCIKKKILRIKDITKLNIEYIAGKNIVFNNSNLGLNEPHKII